MYWSASIKNNNCLKDSISGENSGSGENSRSGENSGSRKNSGSGENCREGDIKNSGKRSARVHIKNNINCSVKRNRSGGASC